MSSEKILIDVICITEHFIVSGQEKLLYLQNYKLAASYARSNIKRGGSCILVKNGYEFKELPEIMNFSIAGIIECCAVELTQQKLIIICVYRPPKFTNINKFYEILDAILKKLCIKNKKLIICGDFNIDILKNNRHSLEFEYFLLSYNLKLQINEPTRLASNTCLDNFAHNFKQCGQYKIKDFGLSDHTAQIINVKTNKTCLIKSWHIMQRDISKENLETFRNYLKNLSFCDVYNVEDPDESYNNFMDIFHLLHNLCFPFKKVTKKSQKKITWISRGIRICSRKQRHLLWQQRLKPSKENKILYHNYSRTFKKIIKLTQKSQNNYLINQSKNKPKTVWQIINKNKSISEPISQIKHNNTVLSDPYVLAESFNNFFVDQVATVSQSEFNNVVKENPHSIFIPPVIPQDIIRIIKSLKDKKSFGYDGVSTKAIKYVDSYIAAPLAHIINACISAGKFPEQLKIVKVKPLYKKNARDEITNYRPISLISIFSKIIEKIIYNSIYAFLTKFNILCNEQKGFRKNTNINMAIFDFLNIIMPSIDKKIPICALFTDLSKAFDYVNHDILLNKIHRYGIRGNVHNLITTYLKGRKQFTEISKVCAKSKKEEKYTSSSRNIKSGVPQGSVVGPLLFLLYVNDLPSQIPNPMVLFADDSTLIIKCNDKDSYEANINSTLNKFVNWLDENNLIINLDKTKVMHFYQRILDTNMNINYNGRTIEKANVTKFLGISIDSQLTWKNQADDVCKRLSSAAYALYSLSKKVNLQTVLIAYHSLVVSVLRFGIIFWGNCSERENIFKAQKRCIRCIFDLKVTDSCVPVFKQNNLLTFTCLYILEMAIFVKTNTHLFPTLKNTRNRTTSLRTQYEDKLCLGKYKTALLRKSVMCMAPLIYNHIPRNIKEQPLRIFKKYLKILLVKKCYYSITDFLNDKSF